MKRGTPDHPKTLELVKTLGCSHVVGVGLLELLWHFTAQYAPVGDIGRWSNARIAAAIHWPGDPDALIAALVKTGWLEEAVPGRLRVHDWYAHADDAVHRALARAGLHFVTGEVPRLERFSKYERIRLLKHYKSGRTTGARRALAGRPAPPRLAPPSPAIQKRVSPSGEQLALVAPDSPEALVALWNAEAPHLPAVRELTAARAQKARARLREHPLAYWRDVIRRLEASPFCRGEHGESDRTWRATFDFLVRPGTATKVLEGTYDDPAVQRSAELLARLRAREGGEPR
jgi:hypothetical protein